MGPRHASVVRQAPGRQWEAQSALAMRATRGLMEAHARHVSQESGKARQELATAAIARQTPTHLVLAMIPRAAPAKRATGASMEALVQRAMQENTGTQQGHPVALNVWQGSTL